MVKKHMIQSKKVVALLVLISLSMIVGCGRKVEKEVNDSNMNLEKLEVKRNESEVRTDLVETKADNNDKQLETVNDTEHNSITQDSGENEQMNIDSDNNDSEDADGNNYIAPEEEPNPSSVTESGDNPQLDPEPADDPEPEPVEDPEPVEEPEPDAPEHGVAVATETKNIYWHDIYDNIYHVDTVSYEIDAYGDVVGDPTYFESYDPEGYGMDSNYIIGCYLINTKVATCAEDAYIRPIHLKNYIGDINIYPQWFYESL